MYIRFCKKMTVLHFLQILRLRSWIRHFNIHQAKAFQVIIFLSQDSCFVFFFIQNEINFLGLPNAQNAWTEAIHLENSNFCSVWMWICCFCYLSKNYTFAVWAKITTSRMYMHKLQGLAGSKPVFIISIFTLF